MVWGFFFLRVIEHTIKASSWVVASPKVQFQQRALPAGLGQTRSPQTTHDTETHTRGTRTTTIMTMLTTMISTTGDIIAGPRTQTTPQRAQVIGQWSQVIDHRSWNRSEACHLHATHKSSDLLRCHCRFARILDSDIHVARVARESGARAAGGPGSNPQPADDTRRRNPHTRH